MRRLAEKKLGRNPKQFLSYIKRETTGITTGIRMIDRQLMGLKGLVGLLGEPKSCKSTLLLQIAAHNATLGNPVYVVDRENGSFRLTKRLLCYLSGRSWWSLKRANDSSIIRGLEKVSTLPLYVDNDEVTFEEITQIVSSLREEYPNKRVILIVDSLQAMVSDHKNERGDIDGWLVFLDGLKLKYEDILTTILSIEMNRDSYGKISKSGGKGSGRIEYKCEQLLGMSINEKAQCIGLECLLNRDGPAHVFTQLEQVREDPNNAASFIFKLQEREEMI